MYQVSPKIVNCKLNVFLFHIFGRICNTPPVGGWYDIPVLITSGTVLHAADQAKVTVLHMCTHYAPYMRLAGLDVSNGCLSVFCVLGWTSSHLPKTSRWVTVENGFTDEEGSPGKE